MEKEKPRAGNFRRLQHFGSLPVRGSFLIRWGCSECDTKASEAGIASEAIDGLR
jgi:hypothetical protein